MDNGLECLVLIAVIVISDVFIIGVMKFFFGKTFNKIEKNSSNEK